MIGIFRYSGPITPPFRGNFSALCAVSVFFPWGKFGLQRSSSFSQSLSEQSALLDHAWWNAPRQLSLRLSPFSRQILLLCQKYVPASALPLDIASDSCYQAVSSQPRQAQPSWTAAWFCSKWWTRRRPRPSLGFLPGISASSSGREPKSQNRWRSTEALQTEC